MTKQIMEDVGIQSYVESWNLIEKNISEKTGVKDHLYVRAAKANMYQRLRSENLTMINKYSTFLKGRWTNPSYFIAMAINKVRTKLLVSYKTFEK